MVLISWGNFYYVVITISKGGVCAESVCVGRGESGRGKSWR